MKRKLQIALIALLAITFSVPTARAQNPGGVTPAAWYTAGSSVFSDAGTTAAADNATVQQWNDHTGSFPLLQATTGYRPVFSNAATLANFNPTVTFDGSNDWMQFTAGALTNIIDRADGTLYAAGYVNQQKGSGFAGFHASMDFPGLHMYTNYKLLFFTSGGPGYQGQSEDVMEAGTFFSAGSGWLNAAGSTTSYAAATVSLNGTRKEYTASNIYNANTNNAYRDFRIGRDSNYGAFSGQLNEIMVFENRLTSDQMDQVETYLAIKYGTTYAKGTRDYKNASGAMVWDATAHAGFHNNIAGIARDDAGALYQKQSWSTNPGQQVLIGTETLANTNATNSGTLTDGQYLIWGDNGLDKAPTIATTEFTGLSHHFAAIWKVQNSGSVGTVRIAWPKSFGSLTLIQSSDAIIDGSDATTSMAANEITINDIVYNYADVTLDGGSFFTFGAKLAGPGGVTAGLMMWHRADDGTTTPGPKNIWKDISGLGRDVTQNNNAAYQPSLVTNASHSADSKLYSFNFNPFYYFDGSNDFFYREGDLYFPDINSAGSTYGVMFNSNRGGWHTPYGWADDDPNFFRWDGRYEVWRDNSRPLMTNDMDARTLPANIGGMSWRGNGINGIYMNIDGKTYSTTSYNIGTLNNNRTPPNFAIGSEGHNLLGAGNEHHQGGISEVFAYSVDHQNSTGDEKQRINSYLAIKYGITLKDEAGTGTPNYLSSNSTVVWDATENSVYNNNIAGIAKDENSALHQKQSHSNKSGQQVLIGTTGLANTNAANTATLNEGQFLVWGDNGLAKAPSVAITGISGVNYRFASVWKVQNTGTVGNVRVAWPTGLTNLTLVQSTDPAFGTVTSSSDMTVNTETINGVAYNYADVTLPDGTYFTFAAQLNGPGGVSLDLRVWLRSDAGFTPATWTDFSGTNNDYTQTNAARQPFVASDLYNFNPAVDFGTTGTDARFMVVPSGKPYSANGTNSTIFTATTNRSFGGYRDIIGFGGTTTGTGLTGADLPAFTNLGANTVLYPHPTSPGYDPIQLNRLYLDDVSFTVGTPGIKFGKNGLANTVNSTLSAGQALHANGSILGAQPEVRDGLIGEVIAYERDLSLDEKVRVRSYVAIKYGITLAHDYVASNGTTIFWDTTANTGYNRNIAGIARDDNGSMYQRQSNSINPGRQVVISTTGLANTNASNTTGLSNQQFLVWGDNGLAKGPAVTFATIGGLPYNRFGAIWKAQNTASVGTVRVAWPAGLTNLKLIISDDDNITTDDDVYDMTGTQTINGVDYAYRDVTIKDGQYFTFAAFVQGPGGITNNLSHWYRADKLTQSGGDGTDLTIWTDFATGVEVTPFGAAPLPKFKTGEATHFNFNPGIEFTATNQKIGNITEPTVSSLDFEIFTLTKQGMGGTRFFNIGMNNTTFNGNNWDHPGLYTNGTIARRNNMGGSLGAPNPGNINFSTTAPSIMYHTFSDLAMSKGLNGAANGAQFNHTARGAITGGHIFGANNGEITSGDDAGFTGHIGELVIYGHGTITAAERNKVDTYLAIKYGVTLNAGVSYVTSKSDTVWHKDANAAYYNNVAGIGNDFVSALHQKQSRSQHTNSNGQVTMGISTIVETNQANTASLADGQFLLWGDNGNTQAMTNVASTFTSFNYAGGTDNARRMNRVWKVQNTDVTDEMLIRFPVASVGTTTLPESDACGNYAILFADDAAFTTNLTVVPLTVNETDYEVMHSFPNGMSYFTFAKLTPLSNGTVYLPGQTEVSNEYITNCIIGEWRYFNKDGNSEQKLVGFSGLTTGELDALEVTITPQGTLYDENNRTTALMARITTVADNDASYAEPKKIRVYYDQDELDAATLPTAAVSGWFKYKGDADDVLTDIFSDGLFDPAKAEAIDPDDFGTEDGVRYVEFHNLDSFGSFVYISTTEQSPLPVTLTYFKANKEGDMTVLNWATANEQNNAGYEVERSNNARNWTSLGFVEGKGENNNSNTPLDYNFTDVAPLSGINYYRLKQADLDGSYEYSRYVTVQFNENIRELTLYPNPVTQGKITLKVSDGTMQNYKIYSVSGIEIMSKNLTSDEVDISSLPAGMYIIKVRLESGEMINKSFIVK